MPVTLNGRTWALSDFAPWGFRQNWMPFFEDLVAELTGFQGGILRDQAAASAASAATSATRAAASAGAAGSGAATGLVYGAALKSLITATDVVSVFVYDTRRDSDGGAWTKKCRGTSWYNEPLNTATRGATRRFPTVALIVARAASLTIYDAHDLDAAGLPRMWMVFGLGLLGIDPTVATVTGVTFLNGRFYVAAGAGPAPGGLYCVNFILDRITRFGPGGELNRTNTTGGTIASRNSAVGFTETFIAGTTGILSNVCNAVHARVLPGAPLDTAGLPIPTVAVATAGGTSVIHPWGAVIDVVDALGHAGALLRADATLMISRGDNVVLSAPVPHADTSLSGWAKVTYARTTAPALLAAATTSPVRLVGGAIGTSAGLTMLAEDAANPVAGMVSYAAINYATGWQPGDIRGAWLGDSTTGSIAGSAELVTNGDFSGGTTGWSAGNSASLSVVSGQLRVTNAAANGTASAAISTVTGQVYLLSVDVGAISGGTAFIGVGTVAAVNNVVAAVAVTTGLTRQMQFTATTTTSYINLGNLNGSTTTDFDNVSVRLALPDRSYKGRGLMVNGTLTRTALPCGLAAVSGFSAANYLEQPYNPDLDFGTGDFWVGFWVNPGGGNETYITRSNAGIFDAGSWVVEKSSGALIASLFGQFTLSMASVPTGVWGFVEFARGNGKWSLRYNGVEVASTTTGMATSVSGNKVLRIGVNAALGAPANAQIILPRIAAYAPTPTQIRRMYEDERALIIGGQPALLGGTSNNVTALASNPDTGALLVGTGDGVSVFSGLARTAYHDGASAAGAVGSDAITAVAAMGPHLLVGTSANAGLITEARIGRDLMGGGAADTATPAPSAVTTDATPTDISPRLYVGEGETRAVRSLVTSRQYGTSAGQVAAYELRYLVRRDLGGSLALLGTVQVTVIHETSAGMDVTVSVDTAAQTVTERVTGLANTRLVWTVERQVLPLTMGENYAA